VHCSFIFSDVQKAFHNEALEQTQKLWDSEYCQGNANHTLAFSPEPFKVAGTQMFTEPFVAGELCLEHKYYKSCEVSLQAEYIRYQISTSQMLANYAKSLEKRMTYFTNLGKVDPVPEYCTITVQQVEQDLIFPNKLKQTYFSGDFSALDHYDCLNWVKSYERYLYLRAQYHPKGLAASQAIELIWHAHLICPIQYARDTINLFGHVLDHDPSYQPSASEVADAQAKWKNTYNISLEKEATTAFR